MTHTTSLWEITVEHDEDPTAVEALLNDPSYHTVLSSVGETLGNGFAASKHGLKPGKFVGAKLVSVSHI